MNKRGFLFSILFAFFCVAAQAQNAETLVRSFARPFSHGGRDFSVAVGNYNLIIPNVVRKVVETDLVHDYFSFASVNAQRFPKLAVHNDVKTFQAFQDFVENARQFQNKFPQIAANVRTEVASGYLDYSRWMPSKPGIIYLGEVHAHENIQREVLAFLRQLSRKNAQRPIIVATEFLSFDPSVSLPENMISSGEDYSAYFDRGNSAANLEVLTDMLRLPNVHLIGLENDAVLHHVLKHNGGEPSIAEYDGFMPTYAGMNLRNQLWANTLTQLRELAPEALIVVYGGISHFSLHEKNSVPSLVPGNNFIIQLATPGSLPYINPVTASLSLSEPSLHMFKSSASSKIVAGWKAPVPNLRRLLGNDLSIIVHD